MIRKSKAIHKACSAVALFAAAGIGWATPHGGTIPIGSTNQMAPGRWTLATPVTISIWTQPKGGGVAEGSSFSFSVVATSSEPLSYQWFFNDAPIPSANGPTLDLTDIQISQGGFYKVVLSDSLTTVVSRAAQLRVYADFSIGVAGAEGRNTVVGGHILPDRYLSGGTNYSSWLGQTSDDGFNCCRTYFPDPWISRLDMKNVLELTGNNFMRLLIQEPYWYKPFAGGGGINQYEVDGGSTQFAFLNFDSLYSQVYSALPWKKYVWGHMVAGESNYFHWQPMPGVRPCGLPVTPYCSGAVTSQWQNVEVPPQAMSDAMRYFRQEQGGLDIQQYLIQGQAVHGGAITPTTTDNEGSFNVAQYLTLSGVTNPDLGDLFLEGSYFSNSFINYLNSDPYARMSYLGKFTSIDFAKQYYNRVISEIDIERSHGGQNPEWIYSYHSNPNFRKNANQLWFQAYGSIIHGVQGVWMYGLPQAYDDSSPADTSNEDHMLNSGAADRFALQYFPDHYKLYARHLAREMRYLRNKGLLSNDPATIVATKTDQPDLYCIVPSAASYLPLTLTSSNARDLFDVYNANGIPHGPSLTNTNVDEAHGLRYTIRTNGSEVVMIIANPNPLTLSGVNLDFNGIPNQIIRHSVGVDDLFRTGTQSVTNPSYMVNRNSSIDLTDNTVGGSVFLGFGGSRNLNLSFGPFDVHVLSFVLDGAYQVDGFDNDWQRVWTNEGSGSVGGWGVSATDKFVVGDFNKTGGQQMLCLQGTAANNGWATMLSYQDGAWNWGWSNYGGGMMDGWSLHAGDKFIVGDFDGDGYRNEMLCIQDDASMAAVLRYNNTTNQFDWLWQNSGNGWLSFPTHANWQLGTADKIVCGDFDGDGRRNELLCAQGTGGKWAILKFEFVSSAWTFNKKYENAVNQAGMFESSAIWSMGNNDQYLVGDLNGNLVANEVICLERGVGTMASVVKFSGGHWSLVWSNNGTGTIGGWGIPLHQDEKILVGNLDHDWKEEFMFLQRCQTCSWATTEQMFQGQPYWHWSNHNFTGPEQDYIDDWYLADDANDKDFFFIKPNASGPSHLIAMKRYGCARFLMSMYEPVTADF